MSKRKLASPQLTRSGNAAVPQVDGAEYLKGVIEGEKLLRPSLGVVEPPPAMAPPAVVEIDRPITAHGFEIGKFYVVLFDAKVISDAAIALIHEELKTNRIASVCMKTPHLDCITVVSS